jgi:hypothetical protein
MPLDSRSIAISAAVLSFFCLSFIGWISDLAPFTCCKRAVVGALIAFIATKLAVKAINTILTNAMIMSQMKQQRQKTNDGKK